MFENLSQYIPILQAIALSAWYGGVASFLGYMKQEALPTGFKALFTKEFWTKFDLLKVLKTVLIGVILGAITQGAIFLPINFMTNPEYLAVATLINSGIIYFADAIIKILVRRTPILSYWNKLKDYMLGRLELEKEVAIENSTNTSTTTTINQ